MYDLVRGTKLLRGYSNLEGDGTKLNLEDPRSTYKKSRKCLFLVVGHLSPSKSQFRINVRITARINAF